MGQQLEFQALDEVERGLRPLDPGPQRRTLGGVIEVDGTQLPHIELELHCGDETVTVHAFESYWAPLTEGRVTLRDVIGFLWRAGVDGLRNTMRPFERWMFDGWQGLKIEKGTAFWLFSALAVLTALLALHTVIALVGAGWLTAAEGARTVTPELLEDLSQGMALLIVITIACMLGALLLRWMLFFWVLLTSVAIAGPALLLIVGLHKRPEVYPVLAGFLQESRVTIGLILLALGIAALLLRRFQRPGAIAVRGLALVAVVATMATVTAVWLFEGPPFGSGWVYFGLWALLLGASAKVRQLLIQYVGDVAVYVSPHRLDRFQELRDEIKFCVGRVMGAVLTAKDPSGNPQYQRVFEVGHSLGSVAAYDVVNRALLEDQLAGGALGVRDRIQLLLTFGSPLDKNGLHLPQTSQARCGHP